MVGDIIFCFLMQIAFSLGAILIFGLLIGYCNKGFYKNFGSDARKICYVTGALGTPVHELCHAAFCLLFGHKIIKIKLYSVNSLDGTLGYVWHTYNPKNFYQKTGNFFIGVAPLIGISALLALFSYILLPDMFSAVAANMTAVSIDGGAGQIFLQFGKTFVCIFSYWNRWEWWIFILISIIFSLHMTLSTADLKGAMSGLLLILFVFVLVDIILGAVNIALLYIFTQGFVYACCFMLCFFMLALAVSLIALAISFIIKKLFLKK